MGRADEQSGMILFGTELALFGRLDFDFFLPVVTDLYMHDNITLGHHNSAYMQHRLCRFGGKMCKVHVRPVLRSLCTLLCCIWKVSHFMCSPDV